MLVRCWEVGYELMTVGLVLVLCPSMAWIKS